MTILEALKLTISRLENFTDEAQLESRLIIQKATGLRRPVLLSHPEQEISGEALETILRLTDQRTKGVPLPYLLEEWEFYGHPFKVTPDVLIPRPETEDMVERAVLWLRNHPEVQLSADIGCGSGCIGVSLLCEKEGIRCLGIDISLKALRIAVMNAAKNGCLERYIPINCDLSSALETAPRLICANLPYIPSETCMQIEVGKHEPMLALDGGPDGFDLYRLLFSDLRHKIKEKTLILCEIEYRQRELALDTAKEFFPSAEITVHNDLAGLPRILEIETDLWEN